MPSAKWIGILQLAHIWTTNHIVKGGSLVHLTLLYTVHDDDNELIMVVSFLRS